MNLFHRLAILCLVATTGLMAAAAQPYESKQGVYEYVVRSAEGSLDSIAKAVGDSLDNSGWNLVTTLTPGAPESCGYESRVVLAFRPSYSNVVVRANAKTGPFGFLDRVNVFEDENGIHVSVVNQRNIIRTVLMNDNGYDGFVHQHMDALRAAINSAVVGSPGEAQYGQFRSRGYIGRTMGVMAGGRFDGKVEDIIVVDGATLDDVASLVEQRLSQPGPKWGTNLSFRLDLPEHGAVLFGTTGTPLDSKSFQIVGAGSDGARDDFACPGLAHAGAYPLEVVVTETNEGIAIRMVDAMYRMKMYFEDAGKIAFMKNMTMPGSIAGEIENKVTTVGT